MYCYLHEATAIMLASNADSGNPRSDEKNFIIKNFTKTSYECRTAISDCENYGTICSKRLQDFANVYTYSSKLDQRTQCHEKFNTLIQMDAENISDANKYF